MTITYPNGTVLEAVVLSHEEHEIRAAVAGCDDVLVFTRIEGIWISEEIEPVTFEFEWQRRAAPRAWSEDDYVCSKELAHRLISTLFGSGEATQARADKLFVFSPEGSRVAIRRKDLLPN